jgi:hypothetical protein
MVVGQDDIGHLVRGEVVLREGSQDRVLRRHHPGVHHDHRVAVADERDGGGDAGMRTGRVALAAWFARSGEQMATVEIVRPYVEKTLTEILGVEKLRVEPNGDVPTPGRSEPRVMRML